MSSNISLIAVAKRKKNVPATGASTVFEQLYRIVGAISVALPELISLVRRKSHFTNYIKFKQLILHQYFRITTKRLCIYTLFCQIKYLVKHRELTAT